MTNPWEALCKQLASSPVRSASTLPCFNSVKIDGLTSAILSFVSDERLLACRTCGVMFLHDKTGSHYDAFHECLSKSYFKPDLLPYHAISLCQKLHDASKMQEKLVNKRLKAESIRKSRFIGNFSHTNHFKTVAIPSTPDHHKLVERDTKAINHSILVGTPLERDKLSSSSSCDRLSSDELNSPSSSAGSSSSAPSKGIRNQSGPPGGFPRRGLMEILQEESASLSSKTRRICGGLTKPLPQHHSNRSIGLLVNPHTSSYPPNSAFPHVCNRKETTYVLPGVTSARKQISVKAVPPDHVKIPHIQTTKQGPVDSHVHSRTGSQFDLFATHSMSFRQKNAVLHPPRVPADEAVNLDPKISPSTDSQIRHECIPCDESAEAVFHLEQESRMQMGRSQLVPPNCLHRNATDNNLNCLHVSKLDDSNIWPSNSQIPMANPHYYGSFGVSKPIRPQQAEKRALNSNFTKYTQGLRNPPDHSMGQAHCAINKSNDMRRRTYQNDIAINSLTQCGCTEIGDLRCKNSILCTIHTFEEKRRVSRSRNLKLLIHEARQRQHQRLMGLHDISVPTKMRRVSPSSPVVTALSTASYSVSPDVSLMLSTSRVGGAVSTASSTRRLPTVANASLPTHHVSMNGTIKATKIEGQSFSNLHQQQPTILHRRVHHPSTLLRRNQQMWGQENPSTSFSTPNASAAELYASSDAAASASLPPPSALALTKISRNGSHIGAGVVELQSRVVVNDEREKSITGRSRKSSRSGIRQSASSMHRPCIQHRTTLPANVVNSTAVLLQASAANQIATKLRGTTSARESASAASTTAWMGFNRPANTSNRQLAVPNSSTTSTCGHSNLTASVSATVANPYAFGSNRWIFIGPQCLNKTGSSISLIQAPHHHQNSQPCLTSSNTASAPMSLEASLDLMDRAEEADVVDVDVEGIEAELEAAAAASTVASTLNETNSNDNYNQQQTFPRTSGGGGKPHSTNVRPSPCSMSSGQTLVFQTHRM